jgi:hypothetical protein
MEWNAAGLTYDGHTINYRTGELYPPIHNFSAPSKEAIHVSLLALALLGNQRCVVETLTHIVKA